MCIVDSQGQALLGLEVGGRERQVQNVFNFSPRAHNSERLLIDRPVKQSISKPFVKPLAVVLGQDYISWIQHEQYVFSSEGLQCCCC